MFSCKSLRTCRLRFSKMIMLHISNIVLEFLKRSVLIFSAQRIPQGTLHPDPPGLGTRQRKTTIDAVCGSNTNEHSFHRTRRAIGPPCFLHSLRLEGERPDASMSACLSHYWQCHDTVVHALRIVCHTALTCKQFCTWVLASPSFVQTKIIWFKTDGPKLSRLYRPLLIYKRTHKNSRGWPLSAK